MTGEDIAAWERLLGRTPRQRAEVIDDLLRHAGTDHMSTADRYICLASYRRLAGHRWVPPREREAV